MTMPSDKIGHTAMVLAAGLGLRMRPLTEQTPKPLLNVAGKPIIAYGFDKLRAARVKKAIVNVHYLPSQLIAWCHTFAIPETQISDETDAILDTGGGIVRALPLLGDEPFFVLNSDSFWIDHETRALEKLRMAWDDSTMDCLLLLCEPANTTGYDGDGDFARADDGSLRRQTKAGLTYIGAYLVHPRIFKSAPSGKFSMNIIWDEAIKHKRLHGLVHDGHWLHVGTPSAINDAEKWLKQARR